MSYLLNGFADELVKMAGPSGMSQKERDEYSKMYRSVKRKTQRGSMDSGLKNLRGSGRRVSRDYLSSTALGALGTPAAIVVGAKITKGVRNKDILKAMVKAPTVKRRKQLAHGLETRGLVGKGGGIGFPHKKDPIISHADLVGHAARGGIMGSVFQMLRDRFSGSAGVKN
jgi:hypothetical protein